MRRCLRAPVQGRARRQALHRTGRAWRGVTPGPPGPGATPTAPVAPHWGRAPHQGPPHCPEGELPPRAPPPHCPTNFRGSKIQFQPNCPNRLSEGELPPWAPLLPPVRTCNKTPEGEPLQRAPLLLYLQIFEDQKSNFYQMSKTPVGG